MKRVSVYVGEALGRYGFPDGHPFGPDRLRAFWQEAQRRGLADAVQRREPVQAERGAIERFHTAGYVDRVEELSRLGHGLLDHGDTPAFAGCYEAGATVVGSALDALDDVLQGRADHAFLPIGGLHHARRERAGGFCIFNDCGVVIETLRQRGIRRVAYVDIDAHHGDGVFYAFEDDPELCVADVHEDGRFLFPGTGFAHETGKGPAAGTKLNIPLLPGADQEQFDEAWSQIESFVEAARPEFVLLQCGADCIEGDPLTHLRFSADAHTHATRRLVELAARHAGGRLIAAGGGGYNRDNLAAGWCNVVQVLLETS